MRYFANAWRYGSKLALAFLCTALAATPVQAQEAVAFPQGVTRVQTVEGITEYRLTNGLRVLLTPDVADNRVNVNMTYLVGSRHEGAGDGGVAQIRET